MYKEKGLQACNPFLIQKSKRQKWESLMIGTHVLQFL